MQLQLEMKVAYPPFVHARLGQQPRVVSLSFPSVTYFHVGTKKHMVASVVQGPGQGMLLWMRHKELGVERLKE